MAKLSKILDQYGVPFVHGKGPPKRSVSYDNAQTTDENRRHWANADALSARQANNAGVRQRLRNRSRYERDNDPYYAGLVRTVPTDMFGTGPKLQCQIEDDDTLNRSIEQKFGSWANAINLVGDLLVAGESKIVDGEPFGILRSSEIRDEPVPLDILWVEAEQCTTPTNAVPKNISRWVDGIELDGRGKPEAYHILNEHPGDAYSWTQDYQRVPADQVLHWFRKSRHGQYRGIPECVSSLGVGAMRRRWSLATVMAAETAANFAVLVTSDLPPGYTEDDLPTPFESLEITRNMITTLPAGGDAKQMKSEHPNQEYSGFKHEQLKELGRPVGAPYSIVGLDGSEHNYSSLRYEREIYHSALKVEREGCRQAVLDPVFRAWYAIARLIPGYLANDASKLPESIPFAWYWPGFAAIDPVKEAVADTERLSNCTTTLQEVLAEYGQDYVVFLKQRARELKLMEELGLPLPAWASPSAGKGQMIANENDAETEGVPATPQSPPQDQRLALKFAMEESA